MSNPLLGSKISLISKKNIRYEGTLYSINETDATVALQNVRAYGTEGRQTDDGIAVPASEQIHPYLLFRGQDIKDLHVHENVAAPAPTPVATTSVPKSSSVNNVAAAKVESKPSPVESSKVVSTTESVSSSKVEESDGNMGRDAPKSASNTRSRRQTATGDASNTKSRNPRMVGSGASLLNRKARGAVEGVKGPEDVKSDFDFESKLAEFNKDQSEKGKVEEVKAAAYSKDDFFDSISCDVLDKQAGIDNRLNGAKERNLNCETFGAASLGMNRRHQGGRGRGGRGGGRGRGGRGSRGRGGAQTSN